MQNSRIDPRIIPVLQQNTANIRNICVLAHVDHGKTTLSDSLVCSNGFISAKLAGKLRYLDCMEEEQQRGITMHTSSIALLYQQEEKKEGISTETNYLINLVDSPGHIDFSSDVSTATRLCDGALVVIDVLEGICTQTHAVLYKALKERMRPCLVLNKIDRLCMELQFTPMEAYNHLRRLIEATNALAATLIHSEFGEDYFQEEEVLPDANSTPEGVGAPTTAAIQSDAARIQEEWSFSPEKGNVLFTSAMDCWGASIMKFTNMWIKKWPGVSKGVLLKYIFDDYCYNPKTQKLIKYNPADATGATWKKPLFVIMILEPIFYLYNCCLTDKNIPEAVRYLKEEFNVEITNKEINQRDPRATVQNMLKKWCPLPDAIFRMIVKCVPSPAEAQKRRLDILLYESQLKVDTAVKSTVTIASSDVESNMKLVTNQIASCCTKVTGNGSDLPEVAEVVVFISKMIPVKISELSVTDRLRYFPTPESQGNATEILMGIGRVFSGVLTNTTPLYILSHRHNPYEYAEHKGDTSTVTAVPVNTLGFYICLGPSVFPTDTVPAGSIVGIVGLQHGKSSADNGSNGADAHGTNLMMSKCATLTSNWKTFPMKPLTFQSKPMVRVAVAPKTHNEMTQFEYGLQQLYAYDPVVEIDVDAATGQHTITCLGELHLEQCVKSLSERFAKCDVIVSAPIVSFRETITNIYNDTNKDEGDVEYQLLDEAAKKAARQLIATPATAMVYDPVVYLPPPWSTNTELIAGTAPTSSGAIPAIFNGRYCKSFANVIVGGNSLIFNISMKCLVINRSILESFENHHSELLIILDKFKDNVMKEVDTGAGELDASATTRLVSNEYLLNGIAEPVRILLLALHASVLGTAEVEGANGAPITDEQKYCKENELLNQLFMHLISFGPPTAPANMIVFDKSFQLELRDPSNQQLYSYSPLVKTDGAVWSQIWKQLYNERLLYPLSVGFHSTCNSGPMMQEPIHGVCFAIDKIELSMDCISNNGKLVCPDDLIPSLQASCINIVPFQSGIIISDFMEMCTCTMLANPVRIYEPIYKCEIQCDASVLSSLYGVIFKRRSVIVSENIIEGTSLFILTIHLPVVESFGFALELLKKTSGKGTNTNGGDANTNGNNLMQSPQLSYSHWNLLTHDPFWKPTTAEELEMYGEMISTYEHNDGTKSSYSNISRRMMDTVRIRKGLPIEIKVIGEADKQRNLSKKK